MDPNSYVTHFNGSYGQGAPLSTIHNKKIQNYIFNLNEVLGRGNFSKVYKAFNEVTNEIVAIKVVELSSIKTPALVQLLYSQIDILKTLKHPNVLNCLQVFTSTNNCYIITQLCDGGDIESKIRSKGSLEEREARKLIYQVYQGLRYLAEQNIVHRDIKIANIFMKNGVAKIADFGFAKRTTQSWKDINIGSPIYMSPEGLIDNIYGPKTDVWAFGVFLYQIMHGDTPLGFCKTEAELKHHIVTPLPMERIKHNLPIDMKDLIKKCLEIDERKRISMKDIEYHPYLQTIMMDFRPVVPSQMSSAFYNLQESKSRQNFYGSQESTNLSSKFPPSNSMPTQNNQYGNNVPSQSPNRNVQKFLSIPHNYQVGRNPSPAINRSETNQNSSTPYQNQFKRGLSVQRSGNTSQQLPTEQNYPAFTSHQSLQSKLSLPYAMVSSKQLEPRRLSPSQRAPGKIITAPITFQECVQVLHYCRLIYKTVLVMNKVGRNMKALQMYSNWLLDMLDEINAKIKDFVRFDGEKAAVRQRKLREVITQYHTKYNKELKRTGDMSTTLQKVQTLTTSSLYYLDEKIRQDNEEDKKDLIKLALYLLFIHDVNKIIESCMDTGNYTQLSKGCNIQNFLAGKKESYDLSSYLAVRPKLARLSDENITR